MLNLNYLKDISGGDIGFMKEMITMLKTEMPKSIAIIQQRFDSGDFQGLKDIVHKYKASLLTLGMNDTVERIKRVEEECVGLRNIEVIKSNLDSLLSESESALSEINKWLSENG